MSNNELLYPRYKVIAIWPGMHAEPFHLGQVITLQPYEDEDYKGFIYIPIKHILGSFMREGFFKGYPHLFKKLEWWEDRKPEEMPQFIKHDDKVWKITKRGIDMAGEFFPVINEKNVMEKLPSSASICWHFNSAKIQPATQSEYEQYINQKEKQ